MKSGRRILLKINITVSFLNVYDNYVHGQLFQILSTTLPRQQIQVQK